MTNDANDRTTWRQALLLFGLVGGAMGLGTIILLAALGFDTAIGVGMFALVSVMTGLPIGLVLAALVGYHLGTQSGRPRLQVAPIAAIVGAIGHFIMVLSMVAILVVGAGAVVPQAGSGSTDGDQQTAGGSTGSGSSAIGSLGSRVGKLALGFIPAGIVSGGAAYLYAPHPVSKGVATPGRHTESGSDSTESPGTSAPPDQASTEAVSGSSAGSGSETEPSQPSDISLNRMSSAEVAEAPEPLTQKPEEQGVLTDPAQEGQETPDGPSDRSLSDFPTKAKVKVKPDLLDRGVSHLPRALTVPDTHSGKEGVLFVDGDPLLEVKVRHNRRLIPTSPTEKDLKQIRDASAENKPVTVGLTDPESQE